MSWAYSKGVASLTEAGVASIFVSLAPFGSASAAEASVARQRAAAMAERRRESVIIGGPLGVRRRMNLTPPARGRPALKDRPGQTSPVNRAPLVAVTPRGVLSSAPFTGL